MTRDALAELVRYNRPLVGDGRDPTWIKRKLDRLTASPFGFLRGTFHLFVRDWAQFGDDPFNDAPAMPVVGDLHLENFGGFRSQDGQWVFDVNDFDETASFTPALDVMRVCTSFVINDEKHGELRAVDRIEAFIDAYLDAARDQDLRPMTADTTKLPKPIAEALDKAKNLSRGEWLEKQVKGGDGNRRFIDNEKYLRVDDAALRDKIARAIELFAKSCPERPDDSKAWPKMIDAATRIAGTGSLGRFRYAVLMPGKRDEAGKEKVLEIKEQLPSSLTPSSTDNQAERVIATIKLMQGASPGYLGTTSLDGKPYSVRELQPTDAKLDSESMHGSERDALCAACGTALGRAHGRAARDLKARVDGRDRALHRRVAAFALRYAEVVCEDWAALVKNRADVEKQLGL